MMPAMRSYSTIHSGVATLNGHVVFASSDSSDNFLDELYIHLEINYAKFFKMDKLAKLAFLGTELVLKDENEKLRGTNVAQLFMNADSSLDSDSAHQSMINANKNVSPSIFVYTLPNILMGEIAIKNQWHGENLFILAYDFDVDNWMAEAQLFFDLNKATHCVGGWVNYFHGEYSAKVMLVSHTLPQKYKLETQKKH